MSAKRKVRNTALNDFSMDDPGHFLNGRFYLMKGLAMIRQIEAESMILFRKRFRNGTPVSG
jgi:hypothetical protein